MIEATQAAHLTGHPNCHQAAIVIVAADRLMIEGKFETALSRPPDGRRR